jgi:hypothetical protein
VINPSLIERAGSEQASNLVARKARLQQLPNVRQRGGRFVGFHRSSSVFGSPAGVGGTDGCGWNGWAWGERTGVGGTDGRPPGPPLPYTGRCFGVRVVRMGPAGDHQGRPYSPGGRPWNWLAVALPSPYGRPGPYVNASGGDPGGRPPPVEVRMRDASSWTSTSAPANWKSRRIAVSSESQPCAFAVASALMR